MTYALALTLDLTLQEIVANIPHDGPSVVAYAILAIFVATIWLGSRTPTPAKEEGEGR
jgi:hypothetical protein